MNKENSFLQITHRQIITIIVCAVLCVIFLNLNLLSFFFLVPLGYSVFVYKSMWLPFLAAAGVNILFSLISGGFGIIPEALYFTFLFLCFAWIMGGTRKYNLRCAYRFIAASVTGAVFFLLYLFTGPRKEAFDALIASQTGFLSLMLSSSSGADAVSSSSFDQILTAENVLATVESILMKGGAVFSMFFIFFVNRIISQKLVRFSRSYNPAETHSGKSGSLTSFFAPPNTIWVLSVSIALIIFTRQFKLQIIEIVSWNVFVICVILFMAQGAGIALFFLERKTKGRQGNGLRFLVNVLIIIIVLSPLNTVALIAVILLGIAENWISFRNVKC